MEFVEIEKTANLSVEQMNSIYNNFLFLKEKFENIGANIGDISDNSVTCSILPFDILAKFNAAEQNIQTFHKYLFVNLGRNESYYKEFRWSSRISDRKNEVWRWIDWQKNLYDLQIVKEPLYDINNELIKDVNNEQIYTYVLTEVKK